MLVRIQKVKGNERLLATTEIRYAHAESHSDKSELLTTTV